MFCCLEKEHWKLFPLNLILIEVLIESFYLNYFLIPQATKFLKTRTKWWVGRSGTEWKQAAVLAEHVTQGCLCRETELHRNAFLFSPLSRDTSVLTWVSPLLTKVLEQSSRGGREDAPDTQDLWAALIMGSEHHLFPVNTRLELWGYTGSGENHVVLVWGTGVC